MGRKIYRMLGGVVNYALLVLSLWFKARVTHILGNPKQYLLKP